MKQAVLTLATLLFLGPAFLAPVALHAQADAIPSAAPPPISPEAQEQRGRQLINDMVTALGGDAWLNRKNMVVRGRTAAFFRGAPTGVVVEYSGHHRFADTNHPEAERIGFITDKSMIFPGKKIDVVQIWIDHQGYEVTFKGKTNLPIQQVEDYYRRQDHSIETVVTKWLKQPGIMVLYEGTTSVERRLADKISVLTADNDAVTLFLDQTSHLPLRRTFESRNQQFQDIDQDAEEYDDYHTFQGLPTAMAISRYHNGDLASQRFLSKVEYDDDLSPDLFNPDIALKKK
jgi:hypothetical protein